MSIDSSTATARHSAAAIGPGPAVVVFDVGGTDLKSALVTSGGEFIAIDRQPTPHDGPRTDKAVARAIGAITTRYARTHPTVHPRGAAVVVPGLVDEDHGLAITASNLGWRNAPLRQLVEGELSLPVAFSHDVRAAGQAEFRLGAARPYQDVVVIAIGTGIASAIILGGRPHLAGGYAGEIGHSVVDPDGIHCPCGGRGCMETIASAGAIARRYSKLSGILVPGAKEVLIRAHEGDAIAATVWADATDALASGLAQVATFLAPEAIVIGGGLAQAGDALFAPLRAKLRNTLTFQRMPQILPARVGENAGLVGAALLARDRVAQEPEGYDLSPQKPTERKPPE